MGKFFAASRRRRRAASALAITFLFVVVAASFMATRDDGLSFHSKSVRADGLAIEVTSEGGTSTSADIPLALVCDYYEHGIEHAPPRDPSGVMQQREQHYLPPSDPLSLLRSKLTGQPNDVELSDLLTAWERDWLGGQKTSDALVGRLERAARRSSVEAMALFQAAKGFEFLDGDELAAGFIRAGLAKAQIEYAKFRVGDPRALSLLHQLDQTKPLWNLKDYPALEARFVLARRLYPPLSVESRRAGYLLADALFYQKRFREAQSVVQTVMAEHRQVGDLGILDRGDLYEMHYQLGYLQFCAGDLGSAISNLKLVRGGGEHDQVAADALFSALLELGLVNEAANAYQEVKNRFPAPPAGVATMATELEEAAQLREWRQQMVSAGSAHATVADHGAP